jgi:ABC-2 type transport system ATP-binding protein
MSSHLISELERVCDHIVLLTQARVQLCGEVADLLAEHRLLTGPRKDTAGLAAAHTIVHATSTSRQSTLLVRLGGPLLDPAYLVSDVGLEDLVLGYLGGAAPEYAHLTAAGGDR